MNKNLRTYLWVLLFVTIAFVGVYGFTNEHAETAIKHYQFSFPWEQTIPFVPSFILIYVSLNPFMSLPLFFGEARDIKLWGKRLIFSTLVAGIIFYFFPAPITFVRPQFVPGWQDVYEFLFHVDHPYNTLPSLHVTFSLLTAVSIWQHLKTRGKSLISVWVFLITLSVLFTHQHHVLDIFAAILLTLITVFAIKPKLSEIPS